MKSLVIIFLVKILRLTCRSPYATASNSNDVGGLGGGGGGGGGGGILVNQSSEIMSLFLSPALNFNFFGKKNEEKAIKFFVACYVISVDYQNFIITSTNLVV